MILLAVILLALAAWKTIGTYQRIPDNYPFASKVRGEVITRGVTIVLGSLGIAGGIGAGCFFAFRRSDRAANIGMIVTLLFPVGALGYQAINYLTGSTPQLSQPTASGGQSSPNLQPATPTPPYVHNAPTPPSAPQPTGPSTTERPAATQPVAAAPQPVARPAPPPVIDPAPILEPLRQELSAECDAMVAKAGEAFATAAKPRKVPADLEKAVTLFKETAEQARALEEKMRDVHALAKDKLDSANVDFAASARESIEFQRSFNSFNRMVASGEVSRFAEIAAELFQLALDNIEKVQVNSKGEIVSKDQTLDSKLFHLRARVGFALDAKAETIRKLQGKPR